MSRASIVHGDQPCVARESLPIGFNLRRAITQGNDGGNSTPAGSSMVNDVKQAIRIDAEPVTSASSAALVLRIKAGDRRAEQDLVRRYGQRLEFLLRRHCRDPSMAPDITQETFIIALEQLRSDGLRNPDKLAAYLRQTALNLATAEARTYYRRDTHPDWEMIEQQISAEPSISANLERAELADQVRQLLRELKAPRDRELLRRYYLSEEPKDSICTSLGLDRDHFDRVIHRARQRFRELMQKRWAS